MRTIAMTQFTMYVLRVTVYRPTRDRVAETFVDDTDVRPTPTSRGHCNRRRGVDVAVGDVQLQGAASARHREVEGGDAPTRDRRRAADGIARHV